jgi:hypothetical protein
LRASLPLLLWICGCDAISNRLDLGVEPRLVVPTQGWLPRSAPEDRVELRLRGVQLEREGTVFLYLDMDGRTGADWMLRVAADRPEWVLCAVADAPGDFDDCAHQGKLGAAGEVQGLPPTWRKGARAIWAMPARAYSINGEPVPGRGVGEQLADPPSP